MGANYREGYKERRSSSGKGKLTLSLPEIV